jgi:hypothetical protein
MPARWELPFIAKLVESIEIDEIRISLSGDEVFYTMRRFGHERDKPSSPLWLADVGVPGSSRRLRFKPESCADYGVEGKIEMAVYPREGHFWGGGAHMADVLRLVDRFCSKLLNW